MDQALWLPVNTIVPRLCFVIWGLSTWSTWSTWSSFSMHSSFREMFYEKSVYLCNCVTPSFVLDKLNLNALYLDQSLLSLLLYSQSLSTRLVFHSHSAACLSMGGQLFPNHPPRGKISTVFNE